MVRLIPFGKVQKTWAVIWGDVSFCSADLDILCIGSAFHHLKFYSFMLMHKISTRVAVADADLQIREVGVIQPWDEGGGGRPSPKDFFSPMGLSLV